MPQYRYKSKMHAKQLQLGRQSLQQLFLWFAVIVSVVLVTIIWQTGSMDSITVKETVLLAPETMKAPATVAWGASTGKAGNNNNNKTSNKWNPLLGAQFTTMITTGNATVNHQLSYSNKTEAAKCVNELISMANSKSKHTTTTTTVDDKPKDQHPQRRRQQILYLHPGPPKTATTTIQQLLTNHQTNLNTDNIFFLGKTMPREKWHCEFEHPAWCITYKQYQPPPASNCKKHMKEQLDEYYHQGVDIILSDEVIGAMFAKQRSDPHYERAKEALHEFFHDVVRSNNWEVRVLIGYRPSFEFAISQFHQEFRARGKKC